MTYELAGEVPEQSRDHGDTQEDAAAFRAELLKLAYLVPHGLHFRAKFMGTFVEVLHVSAHRADCLADLVELPRSRHGSATERHTAAIMAGMTRLTAAMRRYGLISSYALRTSCGCGGKLSQHYPESSF